MNNLTNSQIKQIIDGAKKLDMAPELSATEWLTDGDYVVPSMSEQMRGSPSSHNLSDLAEILALRERVSELELIAEAVAHIGVDFGYGKYELEDKHIENARNLLQPPKEQSDGN